MNAKEAFICSIDLFFYVHSSELSTRISFRQFSYTKDQGKKRIELKHRDTINRECVLKSTSGECIVLHVCLRFNVYLLSIVGFFLQSFSACICFEYYFFLHHLMYCFSPHRILANLSNKKL